MSGLTVGLEVEAGRFVIPPIQDLILRRPLHRLFPRGKNKSRAVQAFSADLGGLFVDTDR